jgi:hypothetical protein
MKAVPWHAEPWPWLLMAGPALVAVALLATGWLAISSDDGLVAQDYYKRGLLINQTLKRGGAEDRIERGAIVRVATNGEARVRLHGVAKSPAWLRLTVARANEHADGFVIELASANAEEWAGTLPRLRPGRWIVTLDSDAWRLPVTTVDGPFAELALGSAASTR